MSFPALPASPRRTAPKAVPRRRSAPFPRGRGVGCDVSTLEISSRNASRLQFAPQLVQKPPVGAVGDDLLRARFDQPDLMQPQRIEAQRVLGIVLPPFVVRVVGQGLQRIVVALGETALDETLRGARRLGGAQIG